MVTTELRGEKVDIVPYSDDSREFVMRALQPAKVKDVILDEESGTATVIVNDYQLSLAIGKEGQNARLAARLTGWRIDIKSESQLAEEEAYAAQEWAEGEWVQNEAGEMVWQPAGGGEALSAEEWEATTAGGNSPPEAEFEVDLVGDAGTVAADAVLEGTVLDGADASAPELVVDVPAVVPAAAASEAESIAHDQEGADGAASAVEGAG
jgi:N utilization substance protein A